MYNKHLDRLMVLTKELSENKKMLEFLELYAILKIETREFEDLVGISNLKDYFTGALEAKTTEVK